MKLRKKTLIIVAVTLCCLIGILYMASRYVLLRGFAYVERDSTRQNVERMFDAFLENQNNLAIKCADWAKWDDTYQFVVDSNKVYRESNLNDGSIGDLKLNYMCFISTVKSSPEIIYSRGYDAQKEEGFDLSDSMKQWILTNRQLVDHSSVENIVAGITMSPDGPLTIVSRPIVTSEGTGPIHGAVIFARYLDDMEINRIAQITHLSLAVYPIFAQDIPPDMTSARSLLSDDMPIALVPLSNDTIAGYGILKDVNEKPFMLSRVNNYRAIHKQGNTTLWYLIGAILIAGFCFGLIIIVLLERLVISRIARLSREINAIGKSEDRSTRVKSTGKDEISNLASAMNEMLGSLQVTENAIRERNQQMRMIMNAVPTGLLSLNEEFKINPEYSASAEEILGKKTLSGQDFFDLMGLTENRSSDRQKLFDFLDLFKQEIISEKEMAGLNPFEELQLLSGESEKKWVRIRYNLIKHENSPAKQFLVTVEDITEEKKLTAKVRQSERENIQLKAIVEDPDLFRTFLNETKQIILHAEKTLGSLEDAHDRKNAINELYRDVHTVKGTASSFGLNAVTEIAGTLETTLNPLRDSGEITPTMIAETKTALGILTKTVMETVDNAKKIMGDRFDDENEVHLKISLSKLKVNAEAINELIARQLIGNDQAKALQKQIEDQINELRKVPSERGLAKALRIVPGLISRLDKKIIFSLKGAEVPLDCEIARELTTPLIHLIRNAFDHGIEMDPDERMSKGKPPEGHVELTVSTNNHSCTLTIKDDGKGIDPDHIKKIALKKAVISDAQALAMSREEALALIYREGFSTATEISDVSGRGVGMDAVVASVKNKLGGTITIDSEIGKGTVFTIAIPMMVNCGLDT